MNLQVQPFQDHTVQPDKDFWQVHMDNGSIIEFTAGASKSSDRFLEDVQRFHRTGEKPQNHTAYGASQSYEFEGNRRDPLSKTMLTIDITKILAIVRN
jgi:hypothetical protein